MGRTFKAKGVLKFVCTSQGISSIKLPFDTLADESSLDIKDELIELLESNSVFEVHDMMTGIAFLECVKACRFTSYQGTLEHVYIDGFDSNLGLMAYGIC